MNFLWFLFVSLLLPLAAVSDIDDGGNGTHIATCHAISNLDGLNQDLFLSQLLDPCRYDKAIKPETDGPLPVDVQIELSHIETSDQVQFTVDITMQYQFNDPRVKYDDISPKRGVIVGELALRDKIWIPHLIVRNQKDSSIMGMDGKDVLVTITPQGDITYLFRMTITFYCWTDLKRFPFDSQECDLRWESWTYNMSSLILHWSESGSVNVAGNLHLTQFRFDAVRTDETEVQLPYNARGSYGGSFSELIFKFKMTRESGNYIMNYYIPSILLVCTSWVTFWLQADAGPPRATLGTSTVIAFITLNGGLANTLPKVSYVKASDVWFLCCSIFIFLSLAEFAFVNVIWRRKKKVELKKQTGKYILKGALVPSLARNELRKAESLNNLYRSSLNSTDKKIMEQNYMTVHGFPQQTYPSVLNMGQNFSQSNLIHGQSNLVQSHNNFSQSNLVRSDSGTTTIHIPAEQEPPSPEEPEGLTWASMTPQEVAIWVDRKSRIIFPLAFLMFNILYWTIVYSI